MLIARKLTKIAHILIRNNQFGYKAGISAIDAVIKIAQYIAHSARDAKILLIGLSNAVGATNRTLLWATLYKKGLPGEMAKHIRRRNQ